MDLESDSFVLGQYRKRNKDGTTKTVKLSDMLSEYENKEAENQTKVMNSLKNKNRKTSHNILQQLTDTPILLSNHLEQFGSRRHSRTGITT